MRHILILLATLAVLGTADAQAISTLLQGSLQAWSNLEIEAVEGADGAEGLDQALGDDDGFGGAHDGSCSSVGGSKTLAISV